MARWVAMLWLTKQGSSAGAAGIFLTLWPYVAAQYPCVQAQKVFLPPPILAQVWHRDDGRLATGLGVRANWAMLLALCMLTALSSYG